MITVDKAYVFDHEVYGDTPYATQRLLEAIADAVQTELSCRPDLTEEDRQSAEEATWQNTHYAAPLEENLLAIAHDAPCSIEVRTIERHSANEADLELLEAALV